MSAYRRCAFAVVFLSGAWSINATTTPCIQQTLDNYTADSSFSCSIGDTMFSGFTAVFLVNGALTALSAVTVVPTGDTLTPTLSFEADFEASGVLGAEEFLVTYTAAAPAGAAFDEMTLSLANAAQSGLAVVNATDALCEGGSFAPVVSPLTVPLTCNGGVGLNLDLSPDVNNGTLTQPFNFNFGAFTTLGVVKELSLTGALGGTASVSGIENDLEAETPEPSTRVPLVVGALAASVALLRRDHVRYRTRRELEAAQKLHRVRGT